MSKSGIVVDGGRVFIDPAPGFPPLSSGPGSNTDRQRGIERDDRGSGMTAGDLASLAVAQEKRDRRRLKAALAAGHGAGAALAARQEWMDGMTLSAVDAAIERTAETADAARVDAQDGRP